MKNKKLLSGLIVLCLFLVVPATIAIIVAPSDTIARTPDFEIIDNMETKQTFTGSVSQGSDSTQHTFDVSSNAEKIDVELSFSSSYDFDLSLWDDQSRRTGGWTDAEHSASSEIPNSDYSGYSANPETITVDPPATTGTWSVGCFAYSGSGSYTITVTITDSTPDTTPPSVSITNPSDGATVSGTVTISATASDNVGVSKVSCKVDSGSWNDDTASPYEWSWDTTGFSDGTHTITCRAYDAAGNYADDQITVTVDNTQGDWGIITSDFTSTSTHSVIRYMGGTSPGYDITVTELHIRCGSSGTVSIALYTGGSLSDPTSAVLRTEAHGISVSSGWNTIDVNDYVVPANSVTWIGWAHSCSVYYSSSSSDAGDFQSDRGRWSQSSPSDYDENSALPTNPGSGSFSNYWYAVYAHYTTQTPDDTTPPSIEITSPSDGSTLSSSDVTVYWSGSDAGTGIDHYEIRIDSGSWVDKGTSTSHSYTGLADGSHTVDVMAYDGAGNTNTDTVSFTIDTTPDDTTPPDISISSPTEGETLTSSDVTVSWSGSDAGTGIDHYEIRIDSGSWVDKGTSTSHSYTGLADGSHTVDVMAYDGAGNTNTDTVTFTIDTSTGPPYTFEGTVNEKEDSIQHTFDVPTDAARIEVTLEFSSSYDFDLSLWDDQGRRTGGWTASSSSDANNIPNADYSGYSANPETITVDPVETSGTWSVGCYSYTGSGSYTITVDIILEGPDTTPPTVEITSPTDGSTVSSTDVTVSWSGSDDQSGIDYYEVRIDSGSWINKGTSTSHTFTGLSEASHTVDVKAWDVAGNSATDTVTFTVDTSTGGVTTYAVIVGISDYEAISDLSYCDEDATDWYNHIHSTLNYDHIWVYGDTHSSNYPQYDGLATEYNVKQALQNVVNSADSDDIIVFTTSGHGSGNGYGSSYLCMWDCSSGENGEDGDFYDTELAAILDDAVAQDIFVFIDHCYSGGMGDDLMAMSNSQYVYVATTCTEDGYGYDDPNHNNGAWTYYFLEYSWINHYGGNPNTAMEDVYDYAAAAYPHSGGDAPQEFDGNTGDKFYLV